MAKLGGAMNQRLCPVWMGYLLLNPIRRLIENPKKLFGRFVREGMLVLEPGCGMGYFTLTLAQMVGATGRVVAVDIQERMLSVLRKRAVKRGLSNRIETRLATDDGLPVQDLHGQVDLVAAVHVVHEVTHQERFLADLVRSLRSGGILLLAEPRGHVEAKEFDKSVCTVLCFGLREEERYKSLTSRISILKR